MYLKLLTSCLVFLLVSLHSAKAEEKLVMGASAIPLLVESPTEGLFIQLTNEIARRENIQIIYDIQPALRVERSFVSKEVQGAFPMTSTMSRLTGYRSEPIYIRKDTAFVREGVKIPKTLKDLVGMRVLLNQQYEYDEYILTHPDITRVFGGTDIRNMQMLSRGRADVFIVEKNSGFAAMQQSGVTNIHVDMDTIISTMDAFYMFQMDDFGKDMNDRFSKRIREIVKDGTYQQILGLATPNSS